MPKHPLSPFFGAWTPIFEAPFSGDVTQNIEPRLFSPDIAGVPEIESKVITEVASYGKQLGKVLEALLVLATKADIELEEIQTLRDKIEAVKSDSTDALKAEAERALARLKKADAKEHRTLLQRAGGGGG